MQYALVPEEANEAIAQYLRCVFLYGSICKFKGLVQADSAVDALETREQWLLNEKLHNTTPSFGFHRSVGALKFCGS